LGVPTFVETLKGEGPHPASIGQDAIISKQNAMRLLAVPECGAPFVLVARGTRAWILFAERRGRRVLLAAEKLPNAANTLDPAPGTAPIRTAVSQHRGDS
jgi:hypothetical protein